jgi:hypothetical protein
MSAVRREIDQTSAAGGMSCQAWASVGRRFWLEISLCNFYTYINAYYFIQFT